MKARLLCTICHGPVAGSQFVDLTHPGQAGMVVAIHVIDMQELGREMNRG